jgi:hypothetical protein
VTFIGQMAFGYTENLIVHKYDKLKYLSSNAFSKSGTKMINFENSPLEYMEEHALSNMDSLKVVNLINTPIKEIPKYCFENDLSLKFVFFGIPEKDSEIKFILDKNNNIIIDNFTPNLTKIGDYAFKGCENLSLIVPTTVTEIGKGSFENCLYLTIKLQEGLKRINDYSFYNCMGLAAINIPASVTYIGEGAFKTNSPMNVLGVKFNWKDNNKIIKYDPNVWLIGRLIMRIPNDDYSSWIIRRHALMYDKTNPKEPNQKTNLYMTNLYKDKGYGVKTWIYKPDYKQEFAYWKYFGITGSAISTVDIGSVVSKEMLSDLLETSYLESMVKSQIDLVNVQVYINNLQKILYGQYSDLVMQKAFEAITEEAPRLMLIAEKNFADIITKEFLFQSVGAVVDVSLSVITIASSLIVATMTVLDLIFNTYIYTNGSFITDEGVEYFVTGEYVNINK